MSLLLHGGGESSIVRRSRKYIVITERKSNFLRSSWSFIWQSVNERLRIHREVFDDVHPSVHVVQELFG